MCGSALTFSIASTRSSRQAPMSIRPTRCRSMSPWSVHNGGGRRLDDRAPEEVGVDAVQLYLIGEHEVTKLLLVEETVLDELPRLFERFAEVRHVPVPDVATHDSREPRTQRVDPRIERDPDQWIVGFATPIDVGAELVTDVFAAAHAAATEVVAFGVATGTQRRGQLIGREACEVAAVGRDELGVAHSIDVVGVETSHIRPASLVQTRDEIAVQPHSDGDAAF